MPLDTNKGSKSSIERDMARSGQKVRALRGREYLLSREFFYLCTRIFLHYARNFAISNVISNV
jgi:hypothetical protein